MKSLMRVLGFSLIVLLPPTFLISFATADEKKSKVNLPASSLSIPWSDFQGILEKLSTKEAEPDPEIPPIDALISSAEYFVDVKEHIASVRVKAEVIVLKDEGWSDVDIIHAGIHLDKVTLDGKPAALRPVDGKVLKLILRGAGIHQLLMEYEAPLEDAGGPKELTFPLIKSQINHLNMTIGEPDLQVALSDGKFLSCKSVGNKTSATGSIQPGRTETVTWVKATSKQEKQEARVSAETNTLAVVGEGLVVYTSIVDYTIQHQPVSTFKMLLPSDVAIADVTTDGLVDWKADQTEDGQKLTVNIAYGAVGKQRVSISYEATLPNERDSVIKNADIRIKNVVRDAGMIGIAVQGNVQLEVKEAENLVPLDVKELPKEIRDEKGIIILLAFKYITHPAVANLRVIRHKTADVLACIVEEANYRIMLTGRGKELMEASYKIVNRTQQYLSMTLPEEMILWGVFRDGVPVYAAKDNGNFLLQISGAKDDKPFEIRLIAFRERPFRKFFGSNAFVLPILDAPVHNLKLDLYLPKDQQYFGIDSNIDSMMLKGYAMHEGRKIFPEIKKDEYVYRTSHANSQTPYIFTDDDGVAVNDEFSNVMTNRALPVQFQIDWEGILYSFSTRIVDPNEKMYASAWHILLVRSKILNVMVLIAAFILGIISGLILRRRYVDRQPKIEGNKWRLIIPLVFFIIIYCLISTEIPVKDLVIVLIIGGALSVARDLLRLLISIFKAFNAVQVPLPFRRKKDEKNDYEINAAQQAEAPATVDIPVADAVVETVEDVSAVENSDLPEKEGE